MDNWDYDTAKDIDLPRKESIKSAVREIGLLDVITACIKRPLLHVYLRVFHRISIRGQDHIPTRFPFVLVANHCSHLDTAILTSLAPLPLSFRLFPIAAGDAFFESYRSSLLATLFVNALPLWRKSVGAHSLDQFKKRLVGEPCAYILFPEGTRSRTGKMGKFKPGIGMIVANQDVLIVPCHIEGAYEALPSTSKVIKPKKITVRIGKPVAMKGFENNKNGWLEIAATLQSEVEKLASQKG